MPPEGWAAGLVLAAMLFLAWAFLFRLGGGAGITICRAGDIGFPSLAAMWVLMMAAMMTPSAIPMVLAYARAASRFEARAIRLGLVAIFAGLYLLVWGAFGVLGAVAEWSLSGAGVVKDGKLSDPLFAGTLIAAAGLYQWTALKAVCLSHCHAPSAFVPSRYVRGWRGAVTQGLAHSAACIGCCWLLMLLAFVGGTMHLGWMAALTVFVAAEKLLGARANAAWLSAPVLIGVGVAQMLSSALATP